MSTIITGNAANVTTPLSSTILSAISGSGVITCTTTTPHLFGNNDTVLISGATGLTAMNGFWTITVTGSSTFTIPTTGGGVYGASSATAEDISLTPQLTVPSDGDAGTADSILVSLSSLADRTQYLTRPKYLFGATGTSIWLTYGGIVVDGTLGRGNLEVLNGGVLTVDGTSQANFNGATSFNGGVVTVGTGVFDFTVAHTLTAVAQCIELTDTGPTPTNAQYQNTMTRTIVQPLIDGGTSGTAFPSARSVVGWTGGTTGQSQFAVLTKLLNGSTLTTVSVFCSWSSAHVAPTIVGQLVLYSISKTGVTNNIASVNLNTTSGTSATFQITGLTTVIDDSTYTYALLMVSESGGTAQAINFYPVQLTFNYNIFGAQ